MNKELKSKGKYELFTTPDGKEVINFDNESYYSFTKENGGEFIAPTESDSDKFSSKATGSYYFAGAESEEDVSGTLYLEDGSEFAKIDFPQGFPTKRDEPKKKIIRSDDRFNKEEVMKKLGL
ncbi:hypothetical protein [Salinimicrobium xinjiangense]|uniref:hypothetical protein n=1 Tax=Salinimicrobium xinjiangense TaxID=438596 RepID=UPI00041F0ED6|nr:hypothetical protein [Salinimicrobium xinjiangense]